MPWSRSKWRKPYAIAYFAFAQSPGAGLKRCFPPCRSKLVSKPAFLLPSEPTANPDAIFTRSSQSAATDRSKHTASSAAEAAERNSDTQGLQAAEPTAEQRSDNEDGQVAADVAKTTDQRAQTVAALF